MNPTKNLIEPKLYIIPTKNLLELKLVKKSFGPMIADHDLVKKR